MWPSGRAIHANCGMDSAIVRNLSSLSRNDSSNSPLWRSGSSTPPYNPGAAAAPALAAPQRLQQLALGAVGLLHLPIQPGVVDGHGRLCGDPDHQPLVGLVE